MRKLSPYTRYQKKPHRYSETYQRWKRARMAGSEEASYHDAAHRKQFRYGLGD